MQGKVIDNDLNPLEDYRVAVYRVKKLEADSSLLFFNFLASSASVSVAPAPIEVASKQSNAEEGFFGFNDLGADQLSSFSSLPLEKYWRIFVNNLFGVGFNNAQRHEDNDDVEDNIEFRK